MSRGECVMEPRAARRTLLFLTGFFLAANLFAPLVEGAQKRRQSKTNKSRTQKAKTYFSQFSHQTHSVAQKLTCDACHQFPSSNWKEVRKG
jgi:hypothetical protein